MIEGDLMYGTQLKYDGSFKNVVKKSPIFWKKNVDIPKNIRKFIDDFSHIYKKNDTLKNQYPAVLVSYISSYVYAS